jgi:deoxyribonuclease-4
MSIAGGYYKAVDAAAEAGCSVVQIFTKNNNQWKAKEISDDDVERFRAALETHNISAPISHASYLINLASPVDELWNKSIEAMEVELRRADRLGLDGVVVHPGAFVKSTEEEGLLRIEQALQRVCVRYPDRNCWILLENTAGQGSCLGWSMAQLGQLIGSTTESQKVGICLDTCHAHAAGYDLTDDQEFKRLVSELKSFGLSKKLRAIHLNDSKKPAGSRVDRHDHIGCGEIGRDALQRFIQHPLFRKLPMYLETAKGNDDNGRDWDVINLETLAELSSSPVV